MLVEVTFAQCTMTTMKGKASIVVHEVFTGSQTSLALAGTHSHPHPHAHTNTVWVCCWLYPGIRNVSIYGSAPVVTLQNVWLNVFFFASPPKLQDAECKWMWVSLHKNTLSSFGVRKSGFSQNLPFFYRGNLLFSVLQYTTILAVFLLSALRCHIEAEWGSSRFTAASFFSLATKGWAFFIFLEGQEKRGEKLFFSLVACFGLSLSLKCV